jgi:4-hydroxybenzoate polyprenyltransferase
MGSANHKAAVNLWVFLATCVILVTVRKVYDWSSANDDRKEGKKMTSFLKATTITLWTIATHIIAAALPARRHKSVYGY